MSEFFDEMGKLSTASSHSTRGCGVYEVGDTERCYVKLFITDAGCVMPVNHRMINTEDLMTVYGWGYDDGKAIQDGDQVTRNADLLFNQLGALVQSIEASGWSGNSTLIQQSQDLLDTLTVAETLDK